MVTDRGARSAPWSLDISQAEARATLFRVAQTSVCVGGFSTRQSARSAPIGGRPGPAALAAAFAGERRVICKINHAAARRLFGPAVRVLIE